MTVVGERVVECLRGPFDQDKSDELAELGHFCHLPLTQGHILLERFSARNTVIRFIFVFLDTPPRSDVVSDFCFCHVPKWNIGNRAKAQDLRSRMWIFRFVVFGFIGQIERAVLYCGCFIAGHKEALCLDV